MATGELVRSSSAFFIGVYGVVESHSVGGGSGRANLTLQAIDECDKMADSSFDWCVRDTLLIISQKRQIVLMSERRDAESAI